MNLQTRCISCGAFIRFRQNVVDRFALAKKHGAKVELHCVQCNSVKAYSVNDIKARQHKYWRLIGVFIFVVGTISVLFTVIGLAAGLNSIYAIEALAGFVVVPYLIYEGIKSHQEQRVNYFNAKRYG